MLKYIFLLLLICLPAIADTPAPGIVKAKVYNGAGTQAIGNTADALNVYVQNLGSGATVVTQGTSPWVSSITNFPATQAVTGPLTDAQLRNSAVSVTGSITTGGLTDAQLRASAVSVTGPLTNAQLRNSAVIVDVDNFPTDGSTYTAQTDGSQKSQMVDGSNATAGPFVNLGGLNFVPVFSVANGTSGASPSGFLGIAGGINSGGLLQEFTLDASGNMNVKAFQGTSPWVSSISNFPATQAVTQSTSPWVVSGSLGRTWALSSGTDSVSAAISNFPATQAVTQSTSPWVISGTVNQGTAAPATPWAANITQFGSSAVVTGTGNSGSGIPRVTMSNDSSLTNITGTISLPTGAATAANQTTGNSSLSNIDSSTTGLSLTQSSASVGQRGVLTQGAVTTNSPTYINGQTSAISLNLRGATRINQAGGDSSAIIRNVYSATNVTSAAYVQLIASTVSNINRLYIFDSSGQELVLATGAAASESNLVSIPPGGWDSPIDVFIPSGTRISIKAVSATASSGVLNVTAVK